ncbi:UNVERIFIED_CONTAM: Short-chain dehydrogenase, chloroplastic [Sesamum radiatum]|uniref:Short-chain dehydrogenase, chloroplastic n=1 Tax=Sesamum radiatum TaxID=300843 RepID=A0AAW2JQ22_SESRA
MIETAAKTGVQGRIVNVSSSIHSWFSGDIIRYLALITKNKSEYDGTRAYALSKLANVLHTNELSRRLTANLVFFLASKLLKTIPQAAATTCYVATNPRVGNVSGKYYSDCNEASTSKLGSSLAEAARLWAASEAMVSADPHRSFPGPQY